MAKQQQIPLCSGLDDTVTRGGRNQDMLQMSFMCGPFAVVVAVWPCGRWSPRRRRRRRCCIHHSSSKTPSESHFPKETKNNAGLTDLWLQFRAEKVAWGSVFCGWGNISVLGYQYPEWANTLDCTIQLSAHPQANPSLPSNSAGEWGKFSSSLFRNAL